MVERDFAETVDTVEEDGIVESKIVGDVSESCY